MNAAQQAHPLMSEEAARVRPPLMVALLTLGDPGRLTGGYLYHQRMAEAAPRHNARVVFISLPERPFPLGVLDAPAAFARAARLGADLVALDSIVAAACGPWLALRPSSPVPLAAVLHQPPGGYESGPLRTAVQRRLDRLAYRSARRILVASESLAERLIAEGLPRGRLRVVPPGRDGAPAPEPATGVPDLRLGRQAALLCVGNWTPIKGIHSLLAAFARLPEPLATLHLAGSDTVDARYSDYLRRQLARPELAGRVIVHGPLTAAAVGALYAAADVFVLPSIRETYGTVYGEAMAAGLPVVGWRSGNLPYLAEHEREGLILPPGDTSALTEALARLAADPLLRRRLGEAARRRALSWPTWEQSAALFFAALREALS